MCNRNKTKLLCISLAILLGFTGFSINVEAVNKENSEETKAMIHQAVKLIEKGILQSYKNAAEELKEDIVIKDYDYFLTMESFYRQKIPYQDDDYIELLAAYVTAKTYCNTLEKKDMYSLPFITYSIDEKEAKDYISEIGYSPPGKTVNYGSIELSGMSARDILIYYEIEEDDDVQESYKQNFARFRQSLQENKIEQSVFISIQKEVMTKEELAHINSITNEEADQDRWKLINTATSLIGKVPYQWGGKAKMAGYDTSWWSFDASGEQKGLDCSGYVQWVYMTAGVKLKNINDLISTAQMNKNLETISFQELKPGDIGLLNSDEDANHAGIYLGEGYWAHCSSQRGTVIAEKTDMFKLYKRILKSEDENITGLDQGIQGEPEESINDVGQTEEAIDAETTNITAYNSECPYSDEDIYLLAQLIYNEANIEGFNGWVAVAEIVKNRVESDIFPNSIREVIYQKNPVQFSDYEKIATRTPSEEQIRVAREVMSGNLKVINNSNVLFFRNANGSTSDWGAYKYYATINNHQFYLKE